MSHIIKCLALEGAQMNINLKALNIAPESPLWKSNMKGMELIWQFSSYMMKNRINFPAKMEVFPIT